MEIEIRKKNKIEREQGLELLVIGTMGKVGYIGLLEVN